MQHLSAGRVLVQAELDAALGSATFSRSPRVARLLRYLRDRCVSDETHRITEYNIAVELLGRSPAFVPADDAIVRVEIHRLRKKLKEYYEGEGASRPSRIVIPTGSYIPTLSSEEPAALVTATPVSVVPATAGAPFGNAVLGQIALRPEMLAMSVSSNEPQVANPPAPPSRWWQAPHPTILATAALITVAALLVIRDFRSTDGRNSAVAARNGTDGASMIAATSLEPRNSPAAFPALDLSPIPEGPAVRILCGRQSSYVDKAGRTWIGDQYFDGGNTFHRSTAYIARTRDPQIYQGGRSGNFGYNIPLPPGTYELRLHVSETEFGPNKPRGGGENSRVFHLAANRGRVLSDIDIFATAGSDTADVHVVKDLSPGPDGRLQLRFISQYDVAVVNALEVVPARPRRMNPIRMTGQDRVYRDTSGNLWLPDGFRCGGRITNHTAPIGGTRDSGLFETEIYGVIDYAIPVAQGGSYDLLLHLAERYWGPENPGGGGPGTRVFDVICNGVALARNVDVFERAGSNTALALRYTGLKPDATGKLRISLRPTKNYAALFALEVHDTTPLP